MKLSLLSSSDLKRLVNLHHKMEALIAKRLRLEAEIDAIAGGTDHPSIRRGRPAKAKKLSKASVKVPQTSRGPHKGKKRGKLKSAILGALSKAGVGGLTVKELSTKIKVKSPNLFTWFYTTGRKVSGLKRVGGKYIYRG